MSEENAAVMEKEESADDGFDEMVSGEIAEKSDIPSPEKTNTEVSDDKKPEGEDKGTTQEGEEDKGKETDKKPDSEEGEEKPDTEKEKPKETDEERFTRLEKRADDNAKYSQTLGNRNVELEKKLDIANKKIEGTYDEEEEAKPDIDKIKNQASLEGKMAVSRDFANSELGKEFVDKTIFDDGSPYRTIESQNPGVTQRVLASDHPVKEALKIVKEHEFFNEHGTDTEKWEESIKKKHEETLRGKLTKEITADIMAKLDGKKAQVTGLKDATAASDNNDSKVSSPNDNFDEKFG